jgi:hypothetical protein
MSRLGCPKSALEETMARRYLWRTRLSDREVAGVQCPSMAMNRRAASANFDRFQAQANRYRASGCFPGREWQL